MCYEIKIHFLESRICEAIPQPVITKHLCRPFATTTATGGHPGQHFARRECALKHGERREGRTHLEVAHSKETLRQRAEKNTRVQMTGN